ncbi:hypothetical protein AJ80_09019 [Polytolypa hystricis UAMH7299]|uniref:Inositolphosphotransferase Aur1/Ipt1 domain-containing protein n=1 Tax=Polytolypa hystricis (strain UAMH7299) TaxID=1447883 RepID=A0A2B7WXK3_POLH7|nr:hypothetical protein AJ80_09019 [Polytolypa hystricis UAMH7299]
MAIGTVIEPLVVIVLLFGGTWINRLRDAPRSYYIEPSSRSPTRDEASNCSPSSVERGPLAQNLSSHSEAHLTRSPSASLLPQQERRWRAREIGVGSWRRELTTPNTAIFRNRRFSRLLRRFPFLIECWYWTLIYWTYQLARAFTAVTFQEETVDVARKHALQVITLEEELHIAWEVDIQQYFLRHPLLMTWTNRLYSFIHIPGTIAFLVWLYYYTTTLNRVEEPQPVFLGESACDSPAGPALYRARRRTMAVCNLLAFVVFTLWPCMPPRLLSDPSVEGSVGELSRSYGFIDTVHGEGGSGSVWTRNRFCNQYAAMPSLHFGYALMIGLTVMTIPLRCRKCCSPSMAHPMFKTSNPDRATVFQLPCWRRVVCITVGFLYPFCILAAIIATANHFILDAVAGAIVCGLAWWGNSVLLNLLPIEDLFLRSLRIHKPELRVVEYCSSPYIDSDDDAAIHELMLKPWEIQPVAP